MLSSFILIQIFLALASADDARLELRASHPRPFAGQEIELALDIHLPAGTLSPHLEIPWLSGEFGFDWVLPPEQWLCEHSDAAGDIHVNDWPMPIPAEKINDRLFRLRWKLTPHAGDDSSPTLHFEPAILKRGDKTFSSNALELSIRDVTPTPPDTAGLNLGVGVFQLETSVEPKEIEFGQETTLTLKISGASGLENLSRPDLKRLPEFKEFLVADGTETWAEDGSSRSFRYSVKPRNARIASIPTLFYAYYDPEQESYQTKATAPQALALRPAKNRANPADDSSVADSMKSPIALASSRLPPWQDTATFVVGFTLFFGVMFIIISPRRKRATEGRKQIARELIRRCSLPIQNPEAAEKVDACLANYIYCFFVLDRPLLESEHVNLKDRLIKATIIPPSLVDEILHVRDLYGTVRYGGATAPSDYGARVAEIIKRLSVLQ